MPVTPTYPGVYIEEIPSGVHTITGVATSVAAFLDFFSSGPMNEAVQILSWADFQRQFGDLNALSEASYAIQQFFLNGGSEAWVVRSASKLDNLGTNDPTEAAAPISDTIPPGAAALTITAISEGTWGNSLRASVDTNVPTPGEFNLTISRYQTQGSVSVVVRQELFRNVSMDGTKPSFVETVVNDKNTGSSLVNVTVNANKTPLANGTLSGSIASPSSISIGAAPSVTVTIGGATPPASRLNFPPGTTLPGTFALTDLAPILQEAIRAAAQGNTEFSGATVDVIGGNQLRILAGAGNPSDLITFGTDATSSAFELQTGPGGAAANVQQYTLGSPNPVAAQLAGTNGMDGIPPGATDLIGSLAAKTGIYALENVDLFNLLCIPRTAITSGSNSPLSSTDAQAVITVAEQYCESRRAFFLMDTPLAISRPAGIKGWMAANDTLRDKNAALYFPRVQIPDPLNSYRLRSFGASGTIAGLCARTDKTRGVWKAPAGTEATLVNVPQLDYSLTDAENGVLNPLGINCLRTFAVYGNICWGARTLEGADQLESDWKYVPVRRFTLFLEESLYRGSKWVVFEPNDEPLWAQIRLNIGAFLQNLFRQGAFQGTSPRDAYFVKCNSETTTQNDIDNGIVNIVVGFAPLKPAEFVILKIQQIAGRIQT
jgi:uncharacterized protein